MLPKILIQGRNWKHLLHNIDRLYLTLNDDCVMQKLYFEENSFFQNLAEISLEHWSGSSIKMYFG